MNEKKDRLPLVLAAVTVFLIALFALAAYTLYGPKPKPDEPDTSAILEDRPETGHVFYRFGRPVDRTAPFIVNTVGGEDYYIKLRDARTSHDDLIFYVRGGDSVEMMVPPGIYEMRYACGKQWHSHRELFGEDTLCGKENKLLIFGGDGDPENGWILDLYPTTSGNVDASPLNREDF